MLLYLELLIIYYALQLMESFYIISIDLTLKQILRNLDLQWLFKGKVHELLVFSPYRVRHSSFYVDLEPLLLGGATTLRFNYTLLGVRVAVIEPEQSIEE